MKNTRVLRLLAGTLCAAMLTQSLTVTTLASEPEAAAVQETEENAPEEIPEGGTKNDAADPDEESSEKDSEKDSDKDAGQKDDTQEEIPEENASEENVSDENAGNDQEEPVTDAGETAEELQTENVDEEQIAVQTVDTSDQATADYYYEPTQREIVAKWRELKINLWRQDAYAKEPNKTDGGRLSDGTLKNALKMINFIRYTAGVAADVKLEDEYVYQAQAASYVNAKNNRLDHYPNRPSGISDALWEAGYTGAGMSDIAMGYAGVMAAIQGWMCDSVSGNIASVGHRCHIIKPDLAAVGFGSTQLSGAPYHALRIDYDRKNGKFTDNYICWPAKNMPVELYDSGYNQNYAFSVGLGTSYDKPDLNKLKVTVTSKKQGKTWKLTKKSRNPNGLYLNVSSNTYSWKISNWIVFNTTTFEEGDRVSVQIEGLTKNGESCDPITYDVNFFSVINYVQKAEKINITSNREGQEIREESRVQFSAEVLPEDTANKKVTWKVVPAKENGGAGIINSKGLFTAQKAGKVTITAKAKDGSGVSASYELTILPAKRPVLTIKYVNKFPTYTGAIIDPKEMIELSAQWYDKDNDQYVPVDTSTAEVTCYKDKACKKQVTEIKDTGVYWFKVTLSDVEDYAVCRTSGYLIVQRAQVSDPSVEITGIDEGGYSYTGKAIRPAITVQVGKNVLSLNKDYTLTWRNNKKTGRAMVIVKGKGNYTGRKVLYFTIRP